MKTNLLNITAFLAIAFLFFACSGQNEYLQNPDKETYHYNFSSDSQNKPRKYSFHEKFDGTEHYWKAYVKDDELVELFMDGEKVDESDLPAYDDFIMTKIAKIEDELNDVHNDLADLKHDLKKVKKWKHYDNDHHYNYEDFDLDIDLNFDEDALEESMEHLKEALNNLKINFNLKFDDEWNEKVNVQFNWDAEEFEEGMQKLEQKLQKLENLNINIDIDMDEFAESMEKFGESMSNLKIDLSGLEDELDELKIELKKLDEFLDETTSELVKDGYINDVDEKYDLYLSKKKMVVNSERLNNNLHQKYLDIYKNHFDKYPENSFRINR